MLLLCNLGHIVTALFHSLDFSLRPRRYCMLFKWPTGLTAIACWLRHYWPAGPFCPISQPAYCTLLFPISLCLGGAPNNIQSNPILQWAYFHWIDYSLCTTSLYISKSVATCFDTCDKSSRGIRTYLLLNLTSNDPRSELQILKLLLQLMWLPLLFWLSGQSISCNPLPQQPSLISAFDKGLSRNNGPSSCPLKLAWLQLDKFQCQSYWCIGQCQLCQFSSVTGSTWLLIAMSLGHACSIPPWTHPISGRQRTPNNMRPDIVWILI